MNLTLHLFKFTQTKTSRSRWLIICTYNFFFEWSESGSLLLNVILFLEILMI